MTTDLTSGLDTAAFSSVIKPSDDLFRFVNGPWIDTYRLPDDKARYGSFDKLAEDAESQIRDILEANDLYSKNSFAYGGLVELIVNCMVDVKPGYIKWEGDEE